MKQSINTSVTVNAIVFGAAGFPENANSQTMGYLRRIAELESMLSDQIAYKEALVAAHVQEMARLRQQICPS